MFSMAVARTANARRHEPPVERAEYITTSRSAIAIGRSTGIGTDHVTEVDTDAERRYLDDLARVAEAGYLEEYVVDSFGERDWSLPGDLDMSAYRHWQREELRSHRTETRIVGYWSYRAYSAD